MNLFVIVGRTGAGKDTIADYTSALYGYPRLIPVPYPDEMKKSEPEKVFFSFYDRDQKRIQVVYRDQLETSRLLILPPSAAEEAVARINEDTELCERCSVVLLDVEREVAGERLLKGKGYSPDIVRYMLLADDKAFPALMPAAKYVIDSSRMTPTEMAAKLAGFIRLDDAKKQREENE